MKHYIEFWLSYQLWDKLMITVEDERDIDTLKKDIEQNPEILMDLVDASTDCDHEYEVNSESRSRQYAAHFIEINAVIHLVDTGAMSAMEALNQIRRFAQWAPPVIEPELISIEEVS